LHGKVAIKVARDKMISISEGDETKVSMLVTNLREVIAYLHYESCRDELGKIISWSNTGKGFSIWPAA
jgi:hypothetical protein